MEIEGQQMTMDVLRLTARGVCLREIILLEVHLEFHSSKAIQINVVDQLLQAQVITDLLAKMASLIQGSAIQGSAIEARMVQLIPYRLREKILVHLREA
jgi:hypothetical protein